MKIMMRGRILPSLKVTPNEIFLSFKEEKPGRHHLILVVKVNIINKGTN